MGTRGASKIVIDAVYASSFGYIRVLREPLAESGKRPLTRFVNSFGVYTQ